MNLLIAFILSTYHLPVVVFAGDTGRGKCPALQQHYHNDDGLCHFDSDDRVVRLLPKVNN